MNSQPRFAVLFSKILFIVLLACTILGDRFLQIQDSSFLCCIFNPGDLNRAGYFMVNIPNLLLFSLLAVGLVAAFWKVIRTRHEVNKLLAYGQKSLPARVKRMASELKIAEEIIVINIEQPFACCFGFLRPRICLSRGVVEQLSADELKATILHEIHHCREFDPLRILLINSISSSLFFLPVVREWGKIFEIEMELNADKFAIQQAGKPALAGAIHRFATPSKSKPQMFSNAVFSGFSDNAVRVAALLGDGNHRRHLPARSLMLSSLSVLLTCAFLLG